MKYFLPVIMTILSISEQACVQKNPKPKVPAFSNAPIATELTTKYGWLNTDQPLSLKDFKGKILLLDFWTYGCINCQHIIPDLDALEKKYANQLVIVGVHSAKFDGEKTNERIKNAISKLGIEHPVINDADYTIWNAYNIHSWPTVVLITPDGKNIYKQEGEGIFDSIDAKIKELLKLYEGTINETPMVFQRNKITSTSVLKYPTKMVVDTTGNIWLSDNGNNRILQIDTSGKILQVIGSGTKGFSDGDFKTASFNEPQGLAIKNNLLYVADSKNNRIRKVDLVTKQVTTIAGNGQMGYYYNNNKLNEPVLPNSPWALAISGNDLYIANAGNHQILKMDLDVNKVFRFAGDGSEGIKDGALIMASFAQPSAIVAANNFLFVADPESSAIRQIDLKNKIVKTIAGKGLFDFGDKDGPVKDALLQHCTDLVESNGNIYIADTYNGKIKMFNTNKTRLTTIVSGLNEPNDIIMIGDDLWIADTNNNQLVKFNLKTKNKISINVRFYTH